MRYTIVLAVLLAACGSAAPPTGVFTRSESGIEVAVTYAATRFPTLTRPPTSTTIPTGTPVPTPTAYQTPTREPTPTFAPSWTPAPPPTATRAPAIASTPIPLVGSQPTAIPAGAPLAAWLPPISAYDCPATHPLKGNKSSMIYHSPGQQAYKATKPEQCFATGVAAVAAGYRAALR